MVEEWSGYLLLVCPALVGFLSLVGGVTLIATRDKSAEKGTSVGRMILAAVLLIVALGVGGCYALLTFIGAAY